MSPWLEPLSLSLRCYSLTKVRAFAFSLLFMVDSMLSVGGDDRTEQKVGGRCRYWGFGEWQYFADGR